MTTKGPQIMLSRTHPSMLAKLFEAEVPEIAEGIVEINAIVRDAGSRAKLRFHQMIVMLIRLVPASACVALVFRMSFLNCVEKNRYYSLVGRYRPLCLQCPITGTGFQSFCRRGKACSRNHCCGRSALPRYW